MLTARTSQWLVLPTPGVPVIIMLGCVLGIFIGMQRDKILTSDGSDLVKQQQLPPHLDILKLTALLICSDRVLFQLLDQLTVHIGCGESRKEAGAVICIDSIIAG